MPDAGRAALALSLGSQIRTVEGERSQRCGGIGNHGRSTKQVFGIEAPTRAVRRRRARLHEARAPGHDAAMDTFPPRRAGKAWGQRGRIVIWADSRSRHLSRQLEYLAEYLPLWQRWATRP